MYDDYYATAPPEIKYGKGYVRLINDDGSEIRVTVDRKKDATGAWHPWPIKDVAQLAKALR